ncbi:MAG: glycogen synthase GlgA [Gammaproteobacteria bacterium]|nr:glycogen synthase GlgA [Gammaproteobacteria bacterium]
MRILIVSSEAAPLVKTGGLADVSAALPPALRAIGLDARLLLPGYPGVLSGLELEPLARGLALLPGQPPADLLGGTMPDGETPVMVLDCPPLYARGGGPYQDEHGMEWADNAFRFAALSRAGALLACDATPLEWHPAVLHCNDWQAGLAPAYLAFHRGARARSIASVHNISFAGVFPADLVPALGLHPAGYSVHGFEFYGALSFLKASLYYADHVVTVSPRYAQEIQTEAFGGGFHGLLAARSAALSGVLNGIDVGAWNPRTDLHLKRRYHEDTLHSRKHNKADLQSRTGLEVRSDVALLGLVGRLTYQKGVDLLAGALGALGSRPWQLVVLGAGDHALQADLTALAQAHPGRVSVRLGFDEPLAHRIEGGADIFLMPSRFEPCGLNQMYSMRYGTPPVARRTGGLADTIVDASAQNLRTRTATGFLFDDAEPQAFAEAIARAIDLMADVRAWRRVQRAGMAKDFSWHASAVAYRDIYERTIALSRAIP